jgi:hypothetical protein
LPGWLGNGGPRQRADPVEPFGDGGAAELFLSAHTVRDHIKSIFSKLDVSSRGELVATIFADHYGPALHRLDPHVRPN